MLRKRQAKKERKGNKERTKRICRGRKGRNQKKKKKKEKKKGKGKGKREDFLALRRSKLDGLSTKVGTHSTIYVWTPKTWSFDKLHKVGVSPTRVPFYLRAVNGRVGENRP